MLEKTTFPFAQVNMHIQSINVDQRKKFWASHPHESSLFLRCRPTHSSALIRGVLVGQWNFNYPSHPWNSFSRRYQKSLITMCCLGGGGGVCASWAKKCMRKHSQKTFCHMIMFQRPGFVDRSSLGIGLSVWGPQWYEVKAEGLWVLLDNSWTQAFKINVVVERHLFIHGTVYETMNCFCASVIVFDLNHISWLHDWGGINTTTNKWIVMINNKTTECHNIM